MFGTSTRFITVSALAFILAASVPTASAAEINMGGEVFSFPDAAAFAVPANQAPVFTPGRPQVLAASQAANPQNKRALRKRQNQLQLQLCPGQLKACSLPSGSYECLDTTQELNACGACLEEGGMDCEAIPNVELVSCAVAKCDVHSCKEGYRVNSERTACVPLSAALKRHFRRKH